MHSIPEAAVPAPPPFDLAAGAPPDPDPPPAATRPSAAPPPAAPPESGDPRSWDSLVRRYRRLLAGVARHASRRHCLPLTPEEIEDLLQDVWCRLFERWGPRLALGGGEGRLYNYLVRTTRNVVRDEVRARRAAKRGWGRLESSGEAWAVARRSVDPRPSPEERAMLRQWRRAFRRRCRCVARRRDLEIVERVLFEGWTSRELAAALGAPLSPSAIDTLVHRVRRRLAAEGLELPRRSGRRSRSLDHE
jgi:RNA polymerase sigma factor (sigma-70 family)